MNIGVIGMGKMGILHTGIINAIDDCRVIALAEKEDTVRSYLKSVLSANIYSDYLDMLRKEDLDLIYITTPVVTHAKMTRDCIDNGINVFVEKPLTSNIYESRELYKNLRDSDIIHAVGYSKRFLETFSEAKKLLNLIGEPIYLKSSIYASQHFGKGSGWRFKKSESGGGVLLELAAHLIDMLLWYFGDIKSVRAITSSYYSGEVEDFVHAILKFDNLVGYMDASWSIRNYRLPEITIEVHGSNGVLNVNDDRIILSLDEPIKGYSGVSKIYKQDLYRGVPIDVGGVEYTREDIHIIECIKKNKQPLINMFEGMKVQAVIDAIYRSINNEREVEYIG